MYVPQNDRITVEEESREKAANNFTRRAVVASTQESKKCSKVQESTANIRFKHGENDV